MTETTGRTLSFGSLRTPVGHLLVAATEAGVVSLDFHDTPVTRARTAELAGLPVTDKPALTTSALQQLAAYFAGELREFDVPIDWRLVTRVQRDVLGTLYDTVPYGRVLTYGELGGRSTTGVPARAIGQVMGANPIPIIVPCHRVVAGSGLGGYSAGSGLEIKRWLLTLEGALPATFDWDPDKGP